MRSPFICEVLVATLKAAIAVGEFLVCWTCLGKVQDQCEMFAYTGEISESDGCGMSVFLFGLAPVSR